MLARVLFRRHPPRPPRFKRVVILGLDGLDFGLTQKLLADGKLPHLAALKEQGGFLPLGSTLPPISPVAWSTFQTGTNPGKHNIFDFLIPDPQTYQPKLSSVEVRPPRRAIRFGKYRIPLGKPEVQMLRKSKPFWSVLSDFGIFNCILRVPITFPPEKLRGVQLSAMCVPDLRGTQGTFSLFTTRRTDDGKKTGGETQIVVRRGNVIEAALLGPDNPLHQDLGPLKAPFTVTIKNASRATLAINGATYELKLGEYTEWISVRYRVLPGIAATGVCRFLLLSMEPDFALYVTPVNIDPEISRPCQSAIRPSIRSTWPADRARTRRSAWRRTPGASTSTCSTMSIFGNNAWTLTASARPCFSIASTRCREAYASACSTAPIACSTCSGAITTSNIRLGPHSRRWEWRTPSRICTSAWTHSSAERWRSVPVPTHCSWSCPTTASPPFGAASTSIAGSKRTATSSLTTRAARTNISPASIGRKPAPSPSV